MCFTCDYNDESQDYLEISVATLKKLLRCFPGSFINSNLEFIAEPKKNQYILLEHCDELSLRCKILEYLSRSASFALFYKNERQNNIYRNQMRQNINDFLGTEFSEEDMGFIYEVLGNSVRHSLTKEFICSGYDMEVLHEKRG